MMPKTGLRVLDAAKCVVDEINAAIRRAPQPLPGAAQLREAAESIVANIGEGFGRADVPIESIFSELPEARPRRRTSDYEFSLRQADSQGATIGQYTIVS